MKSKGICIEGYRALPFSQVVRAGDLLFVSGQTAYDGDTGRVEVQGLSAQVELVLERISDMLRQCGGSLDDVVKVNAFLKNRTDFATFNSVYARYFKTAPPARTTVVVDFCADVLVEIEAVACVPQR
ncbi:MAG: RidA family protein [Firmicutes bacterium]|nr:RidA family protein [Bacillota bacterium]